MEKSTEFDLRNKEDCLPTKELLLEYVAEDRKWLAEKESNLPRIRRNVLLKGIAIPLFVLLLIVVRWRWILEQPWWKAMFLLLILSFWLLSPVWNARTQIKAAHEGIEFARETLANSLADADLPQEELLINGVEHGK